MITPEETLHLQRTLSDLHGQRRVAEGLVVACCLLAAIQLFAEHETLHQVFDGMASLMGIAAVAAYSRACCLAKARELEAQIARDEA
jgi:hypothetical protein